MQERLQKILSQAGVASRREAENIILDGRVAVNGVVVTELGTKADPEADSITVDGKKLTVAEKRVYLILNKPVGYMTTMKDPEGRPIVTDLLKGVPERVYPVGRLDYNTEGLLILTNDGALANNLMHPSHEVDKGYLVRVSGQVAETQMQKLAEGVMLEDGMTAPAKVLPVSSSENNSWISVTIHEGRYRQVRRMCEAVGLKVVRLKRTRYDFLELGEMRPGQFRYLTPQEVGRLKGEPATPGRERASERAPRETGAAPQRAPRTAAAAPARGAGARGAKDASSRTAGGARGDDRRASRDGKPQPGEGGQKREEARPWRDDRAQRDGKSPVREGRGPQGESRGPQGENRGPARGGKGPRRPR